MRGSGRAAAALALLVLLVRFAAAAPGGAAAAPRGAAAAPGRAAAPPGGEPRVEVELPRAQPAVGDRVEAVLLLEVPAAELAGEPRFPAWRESWGEAEIVEKGEPRRSNLLEGGAGPRKDSGFALYRQRLVLAAFRPGRIELPRVPVAVPGKLRTVQALTPAGLALVVRSVIPPGEKNPRPRPAAGLRPWPLGAPFVWSAAALALACLAGTWLLWRRRRVDAAASEGAAGSEAALDPLSELLAALDRLAGETAALPMHVRLSHALRRFLGRTLSFPAPESTTSEIHRQLASRRVPAALARPTVDLLRACDLVKFARHDVDPVRASARLDTARQLARGLETLLHPPEAG
ncbi:MAG TPA: hypothetical protein VHQ90_11630 [Thermoanaerobaculia bacterium]|nr:hypothetical protein [Thermoanaerobaculia bacterium]